jgi:hypothetical protein
VLFHRCHERLAATLYRHGLSDEMIRATPQQSLEPRLALDQRQRPQILPIEPQQIKGDKTRFLAA